MSKRYSAVIGAYQDILSVEQTSLPPVSSTYELLKRSSREHANALALSFFLRVEDHQQPFRWSHTELFADITRAANLFRKLGIQKGDVVGLVLPNLPETHIAMWGAQTAGIAFAVNTQLEGAQMGQLLRAAKVSFLVTLGPACDAEIWQRVKTACADLPGLRGILLVDSRRYQIPLPDMERHTDSDMSLPLLDFHEQLLDCSGDELEFSPPAADDIAAYFCTGGTTGLPKIAMHTHRNEVLFCEQLDAVVGKPVLRTGRTVLTALPLFHVNALLGTGLAAFAKGGHVLLATPQGYRAPGLIQRFWEIVATHQVSSYSGVPTIFAGLLQVPNQGWDTSSLTLAVCGAAPMPAELIRRFEQQSGQRILEGYGLTEGTCASSINPALGNRHPGSIGLRLPWQDMKAMIVDEHGQWVRDADVDEVGVICISGPNVFAGYLDTSHNKGVWFETPDGRRWFNTGDLGRQDEQGFFWLTGRKKELIIRGGHNIDPRSIEDALAAHPSVAMCAAVGRPDAYAGELPVAYVQLRLGSTTTTQELMAHAEQLISERAAIPKELILVDALPLTAVGKTFKPALVMREVEQTVRREAAALGVTLLAVDVEQCSRQGLVARYRCDGDHALLADVLASYAFTSQAL